MVKMKPKKKNAAAVSLGRKGGLAQGWKNMTPAARKLRAMTAAQARWSKAGEK